MSSGLRVHGGAPIVPPKIPHDAASPAAATLPAQSAEASAQNSARRTASGRRKEGMLREAFAATRNVLRSPAAKELGATLLSELEKTLGDAARNPDSASGAGGQLAGLAGLTGESAARNPQLIIGAFKFLVGAAKSRLEEGRGANQAQRDAGGAPASPAAGHSAASQAAAPQAAAPQGSAPQAAAPQGSALQGSAPQAAAPQGSAPQAAAPQAAAPAQASAVPASASPQAEPAAASQAETPPAPGATPAATPAAAPHPMSSDALLDRMREMTDELGQLSKDTSLTGTVQAKAKMAELEKLADLIMTMIQMDVAISKKGNSIAAHAI